MITMDMFSPYYQLAKQLFPKFAKNSTRPFFISMQNTLVVLWTVSVFKLWINSTENRRNTEPWNVTGNWYNKIACKLSDKRFYRPMFRMHLTNKENRKLLSFSEELRQHYELYQLLLFHFQEKNSDHFFDLIEQEIATVNPIFQTVLKTF